MKSIKPLQLGITLNALIIFSIFTYGQTIINAGPVSGTWTASGSPYHIMGDIEVPVGNTLVIDPGVTVKIFAELSFKIYGQLLAQGNETSSIFFIPIAECWKGLQIINSADTSKLRFCTFNGFDNITPNGDGIYGGVLYALNCSIIITKCNFASNLIHTSSNSSNTSHGYGGAVCFKNTVGKVSSCNFSANAIYGSGSVAEGGCIYSYGNIKFDNNLISNNSAFSTSHANGGGVYISGGEFIRNTVNNNLCRSDDFGEGIEWAYAYAISKGGGLCISNCILKDNLIYDNNCEAEATAIAGPYGWSEAFAEAYGGGIYTNWKLENNFISGNYCDAMAGSTGIYSSTNKGGGVWSSHSMLNNTIVSNICSEGSGVYGGTLKNCIVYYNQGGSGNPQITGYSSFCCIEGGSAGQGNINSDPLFTEGSLGEYYLSQIASGQKQQSPCADAGDPSSEPILGTTRTDELADTGIVDLGFHYFCEPRVVANFNFDECFGKIPLYIQFSNNSIYSLCSPVLQAWDFEDDGIIDSYDENPIWIFLQPGNYSVRLIVKALAENNTIFSDTVLKENIIQACLLNSDFTQDVLYGATPLTVNFFDSSIIENTELSGWQWDFENDGIIDSYEQNPIWNYYEPGIYSIKLIVNDTSGLISDTLIKSNHINVCEIEPDFYADKLSGSVPLEVNFFDLTNILYSSVAEFQWDFQNDGIIDSYSQNPSWIYENQGHFTVQLIVKDTSGFIIDTIIKVNYIEANTSGIIPFNGNEREKLIVFPNPFNNYVIIEFEFDQPEKVDLQFFNFAFYPLATITKNEKVEKGKKTWNWVGLKHNMESGIYYISLTTASGKHFIKKCIKVN
ncbi:MAG: hypothetical protein R2750_02690 [Bacteroidales bacterium]